MITTSGTSTGPLQANERTERPQEMALVAMLTAGAELAAQGTFAQLLTAIDGRSGVAQSADTETGRRHTEAGSENGRWSAERQVGDRRTGHTFRPDCWTTGTSRGERPRRGKRQAMTGSGRERHLAVADRRGLDKAGDTGQESHVVQNSARTTIVSDRIVLMGTGPHRAPGAANPGGLGSAPGGRAGTVVPVQHTEELTGEAPVPGEAKATIPAGSGTAAAPSAAATAALTATVVRQPPGGTGQAVAGTVPVAADRGGMNAAAATSESGGRGTSGNGEAQRLARQLSLRLATARGLRRGSGTLRLRLQPGRLGGVEVMFRGEGGRLEITLDAEQAETRALLREGRHELQALLQARTSDWDRIEVRITQEPDEGDSEHHDQTADDQSGQRQDSRHEREAGA